MTADTTCTGTPMATASISALRALGIGAQVGLGQHHDRRGAALPGGGEVALDAARVEVRVERGHQEGNVDIGRHDLRGMRAADRLAHEGAAAREQVMDGGAALRGADGRATQSPATG